VEYLKSARTRAAIRAHTVRRRSLSARKATPMTICGAFCFPTVLSGFHVL